MKPTELGHFDGERCKPFYHEGNEQGILLIHGFTGSAAHMRKLADSLAEKGYTVRSINLPGHATTEENMAKADWKQWLQAAKEATLEMLHKQKTVTVCGLSMGGVLALLVAEQMKVDACVPISAPMATKNKFMPFAHIAAPFIKRIAWEPPAERSTVLDSTYDFGYTGFPTQKAADLNHLIKLARQNLFNITCPVLCVQSDGDETIWEGSADCILQGVGSESRQKLWLHGVPHVCTISKEEPAIAKAIDALMQKLGMEKAKE
ncbi:MAG: alpha/beta fold hydrolase [Clostridia bacterium]